MYLLNKEMLQFLSLIFAVYNQERVLMACAWYIHINIILKLALIKRLVSGSYTDVNNAEIGSGNRVIQGLGVDQKLFETN